jgi:hypothetical protein
VTYSDEVVAYSARGNGCRVRTTRYVVLIEGVLSNSWGKTGYMSVSKGTHERQVPSTNGE